MIKKYLSIIPVLLTCQIDANHYAVTTFVPKQLAYNPILENSLTFDMRKKSADYDYYFAAKPIYTRSVGSNFKNYFNINHQDSMNVQENGSGDIDPLWLEVISSDPTYYTSTLKFAPIRQVYGSMFYFAMQLPKNLTLAINTALVAAKHNLQPTETTSSNLGSSQYLNVLASLASTERIYGKAISQNLTKTGLDDIQIKLIRNFCNTDQSSFDMYALLGLPTNVGTKAVYTFEPLVGSKHVQLGLGATYFNNFYNSDSYQIAFLSEAKWRYGFQATERRLFDLTANQQWSHYMLLVHEVAKSDSFFASNKLSLQASITPRNSFDLYFALNFARNKWQCEIGYDFWYRQQEKVKTNSNTVLAPSMGIADLVGIASLSPQSASTANISQSVATGSNQMVSDTSFVSITLNDLNLDSAAAPKALSNSVYGSISYDYDTCKYPVLIGLNASYEVGHKTNTPSIVYAWLNLDFIF